LKKDLLSVSNSITRRNFVSAAAAIPALLGHSAFAAGGADITVGITVDTRPDWNGPANFMRSIQEASSIGYHWVETFWEYVERWEYDPQGLKETLAALNLKLETVSNGAGQRTDFGDPRKRPGVVDDHVKLVSWIKQFGCDHLKINLGRPVPVTGAERVAMLKEMGITLSEIGKEAADFGVKFGVHAHLGSNFASRQDIDQVMEETDPQYVKLILDTGHITMLGMDPVELTRTYVSRIIEFHIKDVAPENRGGYKGPPLENGQYNTNSQNLVFFPAGKGGVDFPAILGILNEHRWKGWFTVELDRTATTAKESATINKKYLENVLKLKV
jgi:inosose dehydratase